MAAEGVYRCESHLKHQLGLNITTRTSSVASRSELHGDFPKLFYFLVLHIPAPPLNKPEYLFRKILNVFCFGFFSSPPFAGFSKLMSFSNIIHKKLFKCFSLARHSSWDLHVRRSTASETEINWPGDFVRINIHTYIHIYVYVYVNTHTRTYNIRVEDNSS